MCYDVSVVLLHSAVIRIARNWLTLFAKNVLHFAVPCIITSCLNLFDVAAVLILRKFYFISRRYYISQRKTRVMFTPFGCARTLLMFAQSEYMQCMT